MPTPPAKPTTQAAEEGEQQRDTPLLDPPVLCLECLEQMVSPSDVQLVCETAMLAMMANVDPAPISLGLLLGLEQESTKCLAADALQSSSSDDESDDENGHKSGADTVESMSADEAEHVDKHFATIAQRNA